MRPPDTQRRPHQDIGVQDIIRRHVDAFEALEGVREGRPDTVEQRAGDLLQQAQPLLTPSQGLFARRERMAHQGPKSQRRMRLVDALL